MGLRHSTGSKVVKSAAVSLTDTINNTVKSQEKTVTMTLSSVKPHIPLIKFPERAKVPKWSGQTMSGAGASVAATSYQPAVQPAVSADASKPVGKTPRGSGIDFKDLPSRFKRQVIPQDEMEFIERGGPW